MHEQLQLPKLLCKTNDPGWPQCIVIHCNIEPVTKSGSSSLPLVCHGMINRSINDQSRVAWRHEPLVEIGIPSGIHNDIHFIHDLIGELRGNAKVGHQDVADDRNQLSCYK